MSKTNEEIIKEIFKQHNVVRLRDFIKAGIHQQIIMRMVNAGKIQRISRGLYMLEESDITANHSFVEVSCKIRKAVICLISALQFHDIGTQLPNKIWIAIPRTNTKPNFTNPPLNINWYSGRAYTEGIEIKVIEGIPVKIYNIPKTIADCFKFRNKIGMEVAIESLKECVREKKVNTEDIMYYASICRVSNIIKPYMESII